VKKKRKLDSIHVRLDPDHEKKLSAIMDAMEPLVGQVNPSQAVRFAIHKAFERMEKPAA
jgi:hypothetical protein